MFISEQELRSLLNDNWGALSEYHQQWHHLGGPSRKINPYFIIIVVADPFSKYNINGIKCKFLAYGRKTQEEAPRWYSIINKDYCTRIRQHRDKGIYLSSITGEGVQSINAHFNIVDAPQELIDVGFLDDLKPNFYEQYPLLSSKIKLSIGLQRFNVTDPEKDLLPPGLLDGTDEETFDVDEWIKLRWFPEDNTPYFIPLYMITNN